MDLMQIRRRLLMQESGTQPVVCPYITDGLVFWLDGIYKGNDSSKWTDLIGNRIFEYKDCTITTDGVQFNGTTSYAASEGHIDVKATEGTIEAVYDVTNINSAWHTILGQGVNSTDRTRIGMMIYPKAAGAISAGAVVIDYRDSTLTRKKGAKTTGTTSVSADTGVSNGMTLGNTSLSGLVSNGADYISIGARKNSASEGRYFAGTIKCVRIYSRKLSQAEMVANQRIDNTRFNLGLSI